MSASTKADDVAVLLIAAGVALVGLYLVKALGGLGGLSLPDFQVPDLWKPVSDWWSSLMATPWTGKDEGFDGYEPGYIPSESEQATNAWNYGYDATDPTNLAYDAGLIPDITSSSGLGDGITDWFLNNRVF